MKRNRTINAGTSLVELLVVIVILLVGILGVIQIFPRGLQLINNERNKTIMVNLAEAEMQRIRANQNQLPEQILSVTYVQAGPIVTILANSTMDPDYLGSILPRIDVNGNVLDAGGNVMGALPYLSGANNMRRVIGEGSPIPAPRYVGALYGGLMTLQFAPIVYNAFYQQFLVVYGNDMSRREGNPGFGRVRPYQYFLEDVGESTGVIHLPLSPTVVREYRVSFSAWVDNGTAIEKREIVDAIVPVGPGAGGYQTIALNTLHGPGNFLGAEYDSFRVARTFNQVGAFTVGGNPDDTAYECILLDPALGLILFHPDGYKYRERRGGTTTLPLVARVNYDVFDWRIIKEEFRISDQIPAEHRLKLHNLRTKNSVGPDQRNWAGLGVLVNDDAGGTEERDFVLQDMSTGGIYTKASLRVDYSAGMVTVIDVDGNPANGVQAELMYPGALAPITITASGRAVRAMYEAVGEWSVQTIKPAGIYRLTLGLPANAQFYAGGSSLFYTGANLVAGESTTRVYFPPMDAGKKVVIGELWYNLPGGGEPQRLENQEFNITKNPADPAVGYPYIDIRTIVPNAVSINYARYGYGVRNIKGASLSVRVLWNDRFFALGAVEADNATAFEVWGRGWRRIQTETMMQKESD